MIFISIMIIAIITTIAMVIIFYIRNFTLLIFVSLIMLPCSNFSLHEIVYRCFCFDQHFHG